MKRRTSATHEPDVATPLQPLDAALLRSIRSGDASNDLLLMVAERGDAPPDILEAIWHRYEPGGANTAQQVAICDRRVKARTRTRLLRGQFAECADMWAAAITAGQISKRMLSAAVNNEAPAFLSAVLASPHRSHRLSDEVLIGIIASDSSDAKREVAARDLVWKRQECCAPWQTGDPLMRRIVVAWANELTFPGADSTSPDVIAGSLLWRMTSDGREPQVKEVFAEAPIGDDADKLHPSVVLAAAVGSYQLRDIAVRRLVAFGGEPLDALRRAAEPTRYLDTHQVLTAAQWAMLVNAEAIQASIDRSMRLQADVAAAALVDPPEPTSDGSPSPGRTRGKRFRRAPTESVAPIVADESLSAGAVHPQIDAGPSAVQPDGPPVGSRVDIPPPGPPTNGAMPSAAAAWDPWSPASLGAVTPARDHPTPAGPHLM